MDKQVERDWLLYCIRESCSEGLSWPRQHPQVQWWPLPWWLCGSRAPWHQESSEPCPFSVGHSKGDPQCPSLSPVLFFCAYKSQWAIKCERKTAQRMPLLKIYITKLSKDEQLDDGVKWWQEIKLNFVLPGKLIFFSEQCSCFHSVFL